MPNFQPEHNTRILYLSHGGGPLPLLGDPGHHALLNFFQSIQPTLIKPRAILVISAHWEAKVPTVTGTANPALIYDYSGFPPAAYSLKYPAPGAPALAHEISNLLSAADIPNQIDAQRGFDHGLFVPLTLLFPAADVPCVQLSLLSNLDAASHIKLGQALSALNEQDVLIIGSGFSFHNMAAFFSPNTAESQHLNLAFEAWLAETLDSKALSEAQRQQALIAWAQAPGARYCHPREEHLLPLHVCYGFAGTAAKAVYPLEVLGKHCSAFAW